MKRIIFVDDDENLLDGLKRNFRKKKDEWEMIFLNDGRKALDYLENNRIDIIITDYKMSGMNGLELLAQVKEKHPDVRRVILTGQSETEIFEKASELAHKYLSKPCNPDEFIKYIDSQ